MEHNKHRNNNKGVQKSWWLSTQGIMAILFIAVIGFYLITEHAAHFFGVLPFFIFLLLCPLMHFFMHHGKHDDKDHKM